MQRPDERGYFGGKFGGKFVPEVLVEALAQLERGMDDAFADPAFWDEYGAILRAMFFFAMSMRRRASSTTRKPRR